MKQQFVAGETYEFVHAGHLGYIEDGVFINRKIIYIRPDIYIVMDECYSGGKHAYEAYYHFNNEGSVKLEGHKATYLGKDAEAEFYVLSDAVSLEKKGTHLASRYNHEEDTDNSTPDVNTTQSTI